MKRVFLTVLDAVGCGFLPDADKYGDVGSNTLGHVIETEHPYLPEMAELGLGNISSTEYGVKSSHPCAYGKCGEKSAGKDTTTGHWEISGLYLEKPFPTYPDGFPENVIAEFESKIHHSVIGNKVASGTAILEELGEEHLRTGSPIVYTSADSVFQIACHEELYTDAQLYEMCEIARKMLPVGRIIARPFRSVTPQEKADGNQNRFIRTSGRRDFSLPPTGKTLLDYVKEAGMESRGVGKIEDIFEHQGITESKHAAGNPACIEAWLQDMAEMKDGLCFTNLVDTDMLWGHRRDTKGFAQALEYIDSKLGVVKSLMQDGDLLIITADHGCDPTYKGTDHTREYIPLMVWHKDMKEQTDLGTRATYADIAATCSEWLGLEERFNAVSFCSQLR